MKFLLALVISMTTLQASAQETKLYHPEADAEQDIAAAIRKAKKEHKFVLIQGGGNWCSWCIEFARFANADPQIDSILNSSFVWYHLNWSKENRNKNIFARFEYPQRFGFPVFIILDENGRRIHTQNSEYLEDGGKSYSKNKVKEFLQMWSPSAFDPAIYDK